MARRADAVGMRETQRRERAKRASSSPLHGDFGNEGRLWDSLTGQRRSAGSVF